MTTLQNALQRKNGAARVTAGASPSNRAVALFPAIAMTLKRTCLEKFDSDFRP